MATAVPYLPPYAVRAGIRRPKGRTDRGQTELTGCPPFQGEPLTTWKLRYKASSMQNVDYIVILPAPCIAGLLAYAHSYSLRLYSLCTPTPSSLASKLLFVVPLSPAHHVIGRESPPHLSRCSRHVVRAHTTATTPAFTRAGQVWRCRTLLRERRAYTCAHLEGMLYSLSTLYTNRDMMYISTVFCHRKPPRRARYLFICHIVVVFVVAPLFLPYTKDISTVPTRLERNRNTTPGFRARMSGNGRKRRIAPRMLQDARLLLHVRAHITFRPPTGDRRAVRVCAAS